MRLPISAVALIVTAGLACSIRAATPSELWPSQIHALDQSAAKTQADALDAAVATLPDAVKPAVRFQKLFLRIISGEAPAEWRGEMEQFANPTTKSPVDAGLSELARAWLARLEMADIDVALRNYYRHNVRFPDSLSEVEKDIPENLRKDPWGGAWIYKPAAPQGFGDLTGQRYTLAPEKFLRLGNLAGATQHRTPPPSWTITPRDLAGNKALEFRSAGANASVAAIQPGGQVDCCTLLFIGDGWALMASTDQLFAVTF